VPILFCLWSVRISTLSLSFPLFFYRDSLPFLCFSFFLMRSTSSLSNYSFLEFGPFAHQFLSFVCQLHLPTLPLDTQRFLTQAFHGRSFVFFPGSFFFREFMQLASPDSASFLCVIIFSFLLAGPQYLLVRNFCHGVSPSCDRGPSHLFFFHHLPLVFNCTGSFWLVVTIPPPPPLPI